LGKAAASGGPQNQNLKHQQLPLTKANGLELGAGVAVDFHADRNFSDFRCLPSHGIFPDSILVARFGRAAFVPIAKVSIAFVDPIYT
jgi:hypothetical protein